MLGIDEPLDGILFTSKTHEKLKPDPTGEGSLTEYASIGGNKVAKFADPFQDSAEEELSDLQHKDEPLPVIDQNSRHRKCVFSHSVRYGNQLKVEFEN